MISYLLALVALFAIYACGWILFNVFKFRVEDLALRISLYWALGTGALTLQLLYYSWLRIGWSLYLIGLLWVVGALYLYEKRRLIVALPKKGEVAPLLWLAVIPAVMIGLAMRTAVWDPDGYTIWNFKAQVFFIQKEVSLSYLQYWKEYVYHMEYPLLLPLLQTWVYLVVGKVHEEASKIIYFSFYWHISLVLYAALRRTKIPQKLAVAGAASTGLVPMMLMASQFNHADILIAYYLTLAAVLSWMSLKDRNPSLLYYSQLVIGVAAWTKNEGMVIWIALTILNIGFALAKKMRLKISFWFATIVSAAIWAPWFAYATIHHLSAERWFDNLTVSFFEKNVGERVPVIFTAIWTLLSGGTFARIGLLFVTVVILALWRAVKMKKANLSLVFLVLSWAAVLFGYSVVYLFTPQFLAWHLDTSLDRLLLHLLPLTVLIIFLAAEELVPANDK